jgi:hypothetical protein
LGHFDKGTAALDRLSGMFFEVIEKRLFPRQEAHLAGCIAEAVLTVNARSRQKPAEAGLSERFYGVTMGHGLANSANGTAARAVRGIVRP